MNPRLFCILLCAAAAADERPVLERKGTLVPAAPTLVSVKPEAFRGDLVLLEVLPHGTPVSPGDVLARIDAAALDEALRREEFALSQQEQRMKDSEEEARLQAAGADDQLAQSRQEMEHARTRLETYLKRERENNLERDRLGKQGWEDRIEDGRDELAQLEKLYGEDELVDATEDIVLKRQKRSLARTIQGFELDQKQKEVQWEVHEALRRAEMELDLRVKTAGFERAQRLQAIARARKEGDLARARFDLEEKRESVARLRRDRERMAVRAGARGILLHGLPDAAPGAGRLRAGSKVAADAPFACVADPAALVVVADVPEADLLRLPVSVAAEVEAVATPGAWIRGRGEVSPLPSSRGQDGGNLYEVRIVLEKGDPRLRPGMRCNVKLAAEAGR